MTGTQTLTHIVSTSEQIFTDLASTLKEAPLHRAIEDGNHAMWCVGHVAVSDWQVIKMVTGQDNPLEEWMPLFSYGTTPSSDASTYPAYEEVLAAFGASRAALVQLLGTMTDADLDRTTEGIPQEWEAMFGTHGKALSMVCWHPQQHAGQLSIIRKGLGMALLMA